MGYGPGYGCCGTVDILGRYMSFTGFDAVLGG